MTLIKRMLCIIIGVALLLVAGTIKDEPFVKLIYLGGSAALLILGIFNHMKNDSPASGFAFGLLIVGVFGLMAFDSLLLPDKGWLSVKTLVSETFSECAAYMRGTGRSCGGQFIEGIHPNLAIFMGVLVLYAVVMDRFRALSSKTKGKPSKLSKFDPIFSRIGLIILIGSIVLVAGTRIPKYVAAIIAQ